MIGFEENEISKNAFGGTEISKRKLAKLIPSSLLEDFQIIASRFREIKNDKIRIYWIHDLPEDPELNHLKSEESRNKFHKIVFNCNWQMNDFHTKLGIPLNDKMQVIELPVDPIELIEKPKDKINLIYFSTPQRGLNILVNVFDVLAKKYPNIHLNVFSSYKIYGWDDADKQFEPLYNMIRNHPQMTYHGFVEQSVLTEHIKQSHILAYPCIWKETACRVLIESMSAGLFCVHPNLGALSDTSAMLTSMYQYNEDVTEHAKTFYSYLENAINVVQKQETQNYLKFVKMYTDNRFNSNKISQQWTHLLESLSKEYNDVEKRAVVENMFVYKI